MMRRPLIVIFLLALLCACGNREKYARLLAEADSLNQNYIPFTTDSTMKEVVDYYDHHGTANERMRAYYLLGCVYRDLGEAPHALECYHDAVDCADTTANDCNYEMLGTIYGQMAMVFYQDYLPENMLEALDKAIRYARLAKDTLGWYSYLSNKVGGYSLLEKDDSVKVLSELICKKYEELGDTLTANTALGPAIHVYLSQQDYQTAKPYLDRYEYHSLLSQYEHFPHNSWKLLYSMKASYYEGIGKQDSAEYYYRKHAMESTDLNNLEIAYQGLYRLYKQTGKTDSLAKYAELYTAVNDSSVKELSTTGVQRIQSLYNYSRQKEIADKESIKAARARQWLLVLATVLVFIIGSSILLYQRFHHRHRIQISNLNRKYATDLLLYNKTRKDLDILSQQYHLYETEIKEYRTEIEKLQKRIAGYHEDQSTPDQWKITTALLGSTVVSLFHEKASMGLPATTDDWQGLRELLHDQLPDFLYQLDQFSYKPNLRETQVCILVKLRFIPSEICALLDVSPQVTTNIRNRLMKKLFGEANGKAKTFDERIRNL